MASSKLLFERSKKLSPGGVHSPVRAFKSVGGEPLFFDRAEGPYIYSVEGERYVDFCQSFGPNILGHRDPDVSKAVLSVAEKAWSLGTCEPYSLDLAEWMVENVSPIEKLRFVCSGTEAVMTALRVARGATDRSKIIKFNGCYHGHVDNMLVKAGSGLAGASASDSAGVPAGIADTTLVANLDDEAGLETIFKTHGNNIAALIIEPLPANFGLLKQRQEFLQKCSSLCLEYGALLIFDEVISGFRVGMGGMAQLTGITPDLVTYGKIMGGGFPVGCYAGKAKYLDLVAPAGPVYQAGTLAANPIGMVAGLATLKKLKAENVFEVLEARTFDFCNKINAGFKAHGVPLKIIHQSSLFWVYKDNGQVVRSTNDFAADHGERFSSFFHALLKQGVYIAPSAYEVGFVSLAHTVEILDDCAVKFIESGRQAFS